MSYGNQLTETEVRAADGRAVTDLPPGVYAVSGRPDAAIAVWSTGTQIFVLERACPHYADDDREPRRDLVLHGKVGETGPTGDCLLRCMHKRRGWSMTDGQSVMPNVQDLIVYPSRVVGHTLWAYLPTLGGAA